MAGVGYAAAVVLAAVFARAALAKLATGPATARTFAALGLPAGAAVAMPLAELALAVGLVVVPGWAAAVALAVLAAFTTFLARAVRAGVAVGCNCFGSARHAPVSWVELLRNGLLAVFALLALTADGPTVPDPGAVLLVVAATAAGVMAVRVAGHGHEEGPPPGSEAPPVGGLRWADAPATVLAFLTEGCPRCDADRPALAGVDARVHVVVLDDRTRATFTRYGVRATPFYVVVGADGTVHWSGEEVPPEDSVRHSAT